MYGKDALCGTASSANRNSACEVAPPRPQPTLDSLIKNCVDFVGNVSDLRMQAAGIRERLCGAWPVDASTGKTDRPINGQIDALEQFQNDAWRASQELREHLNAIQGALG